MNSGDGFCSGCLFIAVLAGVLFFIFAGMDNFGDFLFIAGSIAFIFWIMKGGNRGKKQKSNSKEDIHKNDRDRIIEEK